MDETTFQGLKGSFPHLAEIRSLSDQQLVDKLRCASSNPRVVAADFEAVLITCFYRTATQGILQWFARELVLTVWGKPHGWGDILQYQIIRTAASKLPGTDERFRPTWMKLLGSPHFCTLALGTLIRSEQDIIDLLDKWWAASPHEATSQLRSLLKALFSRSRDRNALKLRLEQSSEKWPSDLKEAVKEFFRRRHDR